jgi:hypothetical protein
MVGVVGLATFIYTMDNAVVNLASPSIRSPSSAERRRAVL